MTIYNSYENLKISLETEHFHIFLTFSVNYIQVHYIYNIIYTYNYLTIWFEICKLYNELISKTFQVHFFSF